MSLKNLEDVQMFMEMTTTDKAIHFAETVKDEIKIIGSDKDFYRYEKIVNYGCVKVNNNICHMSQTFLII